MRSRLAIVGLGLGLELAACKTAGEPARPSVEDPAAQYVPFLQRKAAHVTRLRVDAPSTGSYAPGFVPEGAVEVRYESGGHELLAWLFVPERPVAEGTETRARPGLLYCHGAFSLGPKDAEAVRPFVEAGLVVLAPAWRGENGNPGRLELLYGEVDDAVAAAQWLAARPEVDPQRVYAVGHSMGGGIAAMLALHPDAPVRLTASVNGIYVVETFQRWSKSGANAELVRFDPFDRDEGELRTLLANVRDLAHPHRAYIGDEDPWFHPNADAVVAEAKRWDRPLTSERVSGDHMSSLSPALARFLAAIEADSP